MNKNFNLILAGVGGQGLITLVNLITEAAFIDGYDVKSSELHGLSQRGGSVLTHVTFGKKVYSPLVEAGEAQLIMGLEIMEGLRALNFGNKNTKVVVNKYFVPFQNGLSEDETEKLLKTAVGKNLHLVPASDICKEKLEKEVVSSIYLLGYAVNKKLMPLKSESIKQAIKKVIPERYFDLNIKALELSKA